MTTKEELAVVGYGKCCFVFFFSHFLINGGSRTGVVRVDSG